MLEEYNKDTRITTILDMFDWYILPVANPDGYAYTWQGDEVVLNSLQLNTHFHVAATPQAHL